MNFASEFILSKIKPVSLEPKKRFFQPDTNVISATFDHLVEAQNTHVGEPIFCSQCNVVLSKYTKISDVQNETKKLWKCEFCKFENVIFLEPDEIPNGEEITYLIESDQRSDVFINDKADSNYVIYCIDVSGSMSISSSVQANINLPTDQKREQSFKTLAGADYTQPRSRVRYITRLEAVQVAIDDNLNKLARNSPQKKIGIVTFNHAVSVIGDGKIDQFSIENEHLESKDEIKTLVDQTPDLDSLKNCKNFLRQKLLDLEEGGATALGPALYYSILLASRKPGSQVILCTDGLANKGIGSFESQNQDEINQFYNEIAELALTNGVSVSIITIEGTSCKLGLLGEISTKTGGMVNVVNPINLKEQFSSILEDQIIATNVIVEIILPKELYIKDHENFDNRQSKIEKQIGNVTKETEITFEFGTRDDLVINTQQLPFQLKISYNSLSGAKFLKVITKIKLTTQDQNLAEEYCNRAILATNAIQTQTRLLQKYPNRANLDDYSRYVTNVRTKNNDSFSTNTFSLYQTDLSKTINSAKTFAKKDSKQAYRELNDEDASKLFNLQRINSNSLIKKNH